MKHGYEMWSVICLLWSTIKVLVVQIIKPLVDQLDHKNAS